ncbi:hypothetical protein QJS66_12320 [Kocuria rhizophila]|nr:hypothetical protein QJS66_12320 [Kocuria rhizophila]
MRGAVPRADTATWRIVDVGVGLVTPVDRGAAGHAGRLTRRWACAARRNGLMTPDLLLHQQRGPGAGPRKSTATAVRGFRKHSLVLGPTSAPATSAPAGGGGRRTPRRACSRTS